MDGKKMVVNLSNQIEKAARQMFLPHFTNKNASFSAKIPINLSTHT
jgi:hypothetical protein